MRLFDEEDVPWEQLAFRTIARTLRNYFLDRKLGAFPVHVSAIACDGRAEPSATRLTTVKAGYGARQADRAAVDRSTTCSHRSPDAARQACEQRSFQHRS